jgi:hypothetical protein
LGCESTVGLITLDDYVFTPLNIGIEENGMLQNQVHAVDVLLFENEDVNYGPFIFAMRDF